MENISKQHIAKLVLGYLKDEKCKKAFRYLLESSPYLRGYLRKVKKGKPISTRICGLNLVDIINEYSAIYRIIQERLEATNYFNNTQGKSSLEEQLIYLLNRVQYSPPSSPCSFATRSSSEKDFSCINSSGNICNDGSHRDNSHKEDSTVDCVDNVEIRTTLSSSLPGNINRSTESATSTTSARSEKMSHEDLELAIELVSQKLLENREFHEKLAENINKEVISFSTSPNDEKPTPLNQELDNVIKTVLQKTEADPLFHKLLTDVLDSVEIHNLEDSSQNDSTGDNDAQELRTGSQSPKHLVIACSDSDQSKKDPNLKATATNFEKLLEIQTSSHFPNTNLTNLNTQTQPQLLPECISNTICVPEVPSNHHSSVPYTSASSSAKDSSISHFINVTSTVPNCITIPAQPLIVHNSQNQGLFNTGGLLMVQQQNPNPSKSYQVVTGKPLINSTPKWTSLNEQDIMSMPTVFISDNQSMMPSIVAGQSLLTVAGKEPNKNPSAKKAKRKIAPKTNNMPSLTNSPHTKTPFEQKKIKTLLPKSNAIKDASVPPKINITITTTTTTTTYEEPDDPRSIANQVNNPIITTPLNTEVNSGKTTTPKSNSSSHVRQLDFSTPEKPFPEDQEENKIKETKEINKAVENVKTKDINSRTKSWDADLRALAGVSKTQTEVSTKTTAKKRKRESSTTNNQSKSTTNEHQTTTYEKKKRKKQSSSSSSSSSACSRDVRETKKTAANDSIRSENVNVTTEVEVEKPTPEEKNVEVPIQKIELIEPKSKHMVEEQETVEEGIECIVINRDIKPTYKRKCNIDNSKRNVAVEKVVACSTTSSNSKNNLEIIDDMSPTLILSPTKLNANKRSIVEVDNKNAELLETPDKMHISKTAPIVNAKRNITPTLETPFKKGQLPPKTPHFLSPVNTSDTPFTKVLKEQLQGLDLSSFPTPKFPLTPDFAVTPLVHDQSPYSRRSTDYSTSSSYYQPSDTEQTKSIEQLLIEEGIRLEKKLETPIKNSKESSSVVAHFSHNDINEKRTNFNNLMIGKKNLSLMKSSEVEKLHLTLSSSDSCSSDNENSKVWIDNNTNDTVIQKKVPYSLRSRGTVADIKKQEEIRNEKSKIHDSTKTSDISNESVVNSKNLCLLQSLEEKRKSVIAKLKQDDLKREKENQKSLQKNQSKTMENKNISKKKGASSDGTRKNNCTGQKKQTQSKINVEIVHSNSEELSKEENSSNKQKQVLSINPKVKVEKVSQIPVENPTFSSKSDDTSEVQMYNKKQVIPSTSKDKVRIADSKEAKIEIENVSDKRKKDRTFSSKYKDIKFDQKAEERVNVEITNVNIATSTETETIDDTSKVHNPSDNLQKITPLEAKNEKINVIPENTPENSNDISQKVITSTSVTKETSVSVEKDEKAPLILREALLSTSKRKFKKGLNLEEDIPKQSSVKNPTERVSSVVREKADLIDSKLENTSTVEVPSEPNKIVVHSNIRILLDKLPDPSLKSKPQIQNDIKEEMTITPHTIEECNQIMSTSNKLNKGEANHKKSDTPNISTFKELRRKSTENRRCRYSPVDEIILHLSSDDSFGSLQDSASTTDRRSKTLQPVEFTSRLLEPFELVQTQLHELSSESERCKIEDQLRKLHEDNSTSDPEILVKELKERGIHLMPAKSSKRNILPDSNKNNNLRKIETKPGALTVHPKEINKKEVKTTKTTKCSQIEAILKEKREMILQNISLEEGEIVSDASDSESKVSEGQTKSSRIKSSRSLPQRKELKVEVNSSKADHKKKENCLSYRDKGKGVANKSSLNKSINKSVKEIRSSCTKAAVEKSLSNKVSSYNEKHSTSNKANIETGSNNQYHERKQLVTEQNISTKRDEVCFSLPFDTKVYDTETLHLIYDESRQSHETKQYNLELLTKKISANVFIEEINSEVEKEMSFTSFTSTLDIPSTLNVNVLLPRKKVKVEETNASPLDKLYQKLLKSSSERTSFNSSPLDSLYSPIKTGFYNRKSEVAEESKKSKPNINEERKLIENKNSVDKVSNRKNLKNKLSGSEGGRSNLTKKSVELPELPDDEIEVIDGIISFNTAEKVMSPDSNDELMNYAICGSVRIENDHTEFSEKKRKANANVDETHDEKKVRTDNCQELLKKIDVDSFLKKVHGNG